MNRTIAGRMGWATLFWTLGLAVILWGGLWSLFYALLWRPR